MSVRRISKPKLGKGDILHIPPNNYYQLAEDGWKINGDHFSMMVFSLNKIQYTTIRMTQEAKRIEYKDVPEEFRQHIV